MTTLTKAVLTGITSFATNAVARSTLLSELFKKGMRGTDTLTPNNEESTVEQADYDKLNMSIVKGFRKEWIQMLAMESDDPRLKKTENPSACKKTLTTANRRYAQQQIGSIRKDIRKGLNKLEAKEAGIPQRARPAKVRITSALRDADKVIDQILSHEDFMGNDREKVAMLKSMIQEASVYCAAFIVSSDEVKTIPATEASA